MTATAELIAALVAGGMDAAEAAGLVARAAVEMTGALTKKSAGALRQQRYRERHKASHRNAQECKQGVTNRNESVTRDADVQASQTVTERNESVTSLRSDETHISFFPSSRENLSKEGSKKDRAPKKRNAPLPDGWAPSLRSYQLAEQHGQNVQIVEQIFRDYLKSSGKLYADYDAAFNNFIRNQQRFGGSGNNGTRHDRSSNSLVAALKRDLAELERAESDDNSLASGPVQLLQAGSIRRP